MTVALLQLALQSLSLLYSLVKFELVFTEAEALGFTFLQVSGRNEAIIML